MPTSSDSGYFLRAVRTILALAVPVQIQGMVLDVEVKDFADHLLDPLQPGVTKFEQLVAVHADEVIVLPVASMPTSCTCASSSKENR